MTNKYKIDFLKESLEIKGYNFVDIGNFQIEINLNGYKIIISETLQETFHFKILNNKMEIIFKNKYETINNLIKYGLSKKYLRG